MTGYHVSVGYNPLGIDGDYGWRILKDVARRVCNDPEKIVEEARRLGAPEMCDEGCCTLNTYAESYTHPFSENGHPVSISEENQQIVQLASTGESIKYHVRRAFIRLLIQEMHRQEIEVSLTVA